MEALGFWSHVLLVWIAIGMVIGILADIFFNDTVSPDGVLDSVSIIFLWPVVIASVVCSWWARRRIRRSFNKRNLWVKR